MGMMSGGAAQTAMSPTLQTIESKIEASVKPDMRAAYQRIVAAAMKFAFDKSSHESLMSDLLKSQDPIKDVAVGTVGLLLIMSRESKGTMPVPAMVPAGMTIVLHGLDYLEKVKGMKIENAQIDEATKTFISTLSPKIGLTPEVMKNAVNQANAAVKNPQLLNKFNTGGGNGNVR